MRILGGDKEQYGTFVYCFCFLFPVSCFLQDLYKNQISWFLIVVGGMFLLRRCQQNIIWSCRINKAAAMQEQEEGQEQLMGGINRKEERINR
jgi:hypothetical protein